MTLPSPTAGLTALSADFKSTSLSPLQPPRHFNAGVVLLNAFTLMGVEVHARLFFHIANATASRLGIDTVMTTHFHHLVRLVAM
jgi:hypothetical protein